MALQIWLPLNGDLHNQGLNQNITVTNNAATVNNNGKIGKCYSFNGTSSTIYNRNISINCNKLSLCCWIYRTTSHTGEGYICALNNGAGYADCAIGLSCSTSTKVVFVAGGNSSLNTTIAANTWNHLAVTYDGNKITGYLNGNKIGTVNNTTILTKKQFAIGCRCNSTNNFLYYFPGKINDVRLYDHCLTDKEVEKISQGLVLHYQLNKSNINLLNAATKSANTTTYNAYQFNLKENLKANQTYIMQLWNVNVSHSGKTADELGLSVYWGGGYVQLKTLNGTQYFTNGHADYLKFSFTPTSANASHANAANAWLNIYNSVPNKTGTMSMSIETWKLEKDNGTSREEPDDSGNNFNGIVIDNTTANRQSPKYGNAIKFNTTSGKIKLPIIPFSNFGNNYTFAWWQYNTGSSNMAWGFKDGNRLNVYQTTTMNLNTGDGNTNQYKTSGGGTLSINTYKNAWHHFCITGDGTSSKLYINGNYIASAITYRPLTGTQIYISGWDAGTSYTFNGSNICDFRIYSTVLSAAAVKELYRTSLNASSGSPKARELE